ncbi:hypothetical protein [uncultured Mailhella sp.]|uniref:hypothetical protein n=1 Tax=uncultured Mailhella sp. TaxID=1981031 RepID=UPI0025D381DE|nr:hypothetical protein [uncultured Mailhella sp.]
MTSAFAASLFSAKPYSHFSAKRNSNNAHDERHYQEYICHCGFKHVCHERIQASHGNSREKIHDYIALTNGFPVATFFAHKMHVLLRRMLIFSMNSNIPTAYIRAIQLKSLFFLGQQGNL